MAHPFIIIMKYFINILLIFLLSFSSVYAQTTSSADFNKDGMVDGTDLVFFSKEYGKTMSPADFNKDNIVDTSDLSFFSNEYGKMFFVDINLYWDSNIENNLAGYKIYYGTSSKQYTIIKDIKDKTARVVTITGLLPKITYYFTITAYDTNNSESMYANEIVYTGLFD